MKRTRDRSDAEAHARSVHTSVADVSRFLDDVLGGVLAGYVVGVDPKTLKRWADGDQAPREAAERRLRAAHQVFMLVQTVEEAPTVRAWFIGMNPQLDDVSPAEAIREDRYREAMSAARAFVRGG